MYFYKVIKLFNKELRQLRYNNFYGVVYEVSERCSKVDPV